MERAKVRGATLEYEVHGSGEPVLLVHGAHVADGLRPLVEEETLAGPFQLIVYHRRGFAGSDGISSPYTLEDQAADARALLAELDIERAHVVGHSYGGAIGLQLAVDAPEVVHTLALLEAPSVMVPSAGAFAQSMESVGQRYAAGEKEEAVDDFLIAVGGGGYRDSLDRLLPGSYEQAAADADTFFAVEFPALLEWGFDEEDAKRIDMPVLRVLGDESIPWFVESDALLGEWMPHSERSTIAGASHLLQMADPAPVAESLATFFGRHPVVVAPW